MGDMILLLFDVSKLDISDEFRRVILAVKGNDQKVHIVLNKVHAYILDYLKRKMPTMFGKEKEKTRLLANLTEVYRDIAKEHKLALGDFPDPTIMAQKLQSYDFSKFSKLDQEDDGLGQHAH